MKPRLNFIVLGVNNVKAATDFYKAIGWETSDIAGDNVGATNVTFFKLDGGLVFGLVPREELAKDAQIELGQRSPSELSLDYNVNSKEEVDNVINTVEAAGAKITSKPSDRAWGGYSGYFVDLGGHMWSVVYNPRLQVKD